MMMINYLILVDFILKHILYYINYKNNKKEKIKMNKIIERLFENEIIQKSIIDNTIYYSIESICKLINLPMKSRLIMEI